MAALGGIAAAGVVALIVIGGAVARPITGGVHQLAQNPIQGADATAVYSTTLSKQQATVGALAWEERVLYGGVDVGGFSVTFTPDTGVPLRQFGVVIIRNVKTASLLDQQIDITYGGEVIAHAQFSSTPPVAPDPTHGLSCSSWTDRPNDLPMEFTCDILTAA